MTVQAFVNQNYGVKPNPFPVYCESQRKLYLPRYYGIKNFGEPKINKLQSGESIDIDFIHSLKPKQLPIVDKFMETAQNIGGGIISVPCGYGKTVIALYIAAKLKVKTLVVVHKEFLLNQWKERIREFIPDAKIGRLQSSVIHIEGYDIVIGDVTTTHTSGTMSVKVADKTGATQGTEYALKGHTSTEDSISMVGQVSLSSHKAFTVKSGDAANHFATDTSAQTSTLQSMGAIDISSQTGATKALSVIDGAIAMISEVRSEMGAAENRLTSTVDNLSNVSVNTQRSLTAVEDANFASETSALTKAQILQQAATSMLAQANKAKQTMLVLLQG